MAAVAIFARDQSLRDALERLMRQEPGIKLIGAAREPSGLARLMQQFRVDLVLADSPSAAQVGEWLARHPATAFIVLVGDADEDEAVDALYAGARAVVPRAAGRDELRATIAAVTTGLAVLPPPLLAALLEPAAPDTAPPPAGAVDGASWGGQALTAREREVLAAMADGASNKAIARRLGISFHTAKFHVAAILAKLDADSRTEAVAKAAHLGLVML
jgi:DNA-binding NarL/FixJ family response regulator